VIFQDRIPGISGTDMACGPCAVAAQFSVDRAIGPANAVLMGRAPADAVLMVQAPVNMAGIGSITGRITKGMEEQLKITGADSGQRNAVCSLFLPL
jgi:hypothetical protein